MIVIFTIIGIIGNSSSSTGDDTYVEDYSNSDSVFESIPADAVSALEDYCFEMEQNGVTISHTYYCDGDKIINWVQTASLSVEGQSQDSIDGTIQQCNDEFETKYASYDFITHNVEVVDGELVETYTFKNVSDHVKDLQDLGLLTGDNMITLYVSLEQSRTQLLAQGFTEVE